MKKNNMKLITVLIITIFGSTLAIPNLQSKWTEFKHKFNKQYQKDEESTRMEIFKNNLKFIENHNLRFEKGLEKYTLEVNNFADLTEDEFVAMYMMVDGLKFNSSSFDGDISLGSDLSIPDSVDWRAKGIMTPVKDQKQCGSCWAFATIGALEARWNKVHNEVKILSEQQLVDCVYDRNGCNGGNAYFAYQYIIENGIEEDSSYAYTAKYGSCQYNNGKVVLTIKNVGDIHPKTENGEQVMASLVATDGPIAASIKMPETTTRKLMFYDGKYIFTDDECENVDPYDTNHVVTVAGYGTKDGQDFWLLKNSWGAGWGDKGYFTLKRNANYYCAIGYWADYPIIE